MEALEAIGHKRLLLLTGEHPKYPFETFLEAVSVVRFRFRWMRYAVVDFMGGSVV